MGILPGSVEKAKFLTEQDRKDLLWLRTSEVGQTASGQDLQKKDVMDGVKDWKTYSYGLAQFCSHLMLYSFSVFLPTVINRLGEFKLSADGSNTPASDEDDPVLVDDPEPPRSDMR